MATKTQMSEELEALGVELSGDEDAPALKALLEKAKSGDDSADNADDKADDKPKKAKKAIAGLFVWLKMRAYVDEAGTKRMDAGFYAMEDLGDFPRLEKLSAKYCEIFEKEVPSMKLAQIAKWSGVNPDAHRDDVELLEMIVLEPSVR